MKEVISVISYTKITIFESLINILVKEWNFSWPIVSHKLRVYCFLSIAIVLEKKEFAVVESSLSLNGIPTASLIKLVFPVPDSPTKITFISSSMFLFLF